LWEYWDPGPLSPKSGPAVILKISLSQNICAILSVPICLLQLSHTLHQLLADGAVPHRFIQISYHQLHKNEKKNKLVSLNQFLPHQFVFSGLVEN